MVAILTGNGLGLERSSANVLGGRGMIGGPSHGRAGENIFVNATNGNLIINNRDELLIGRGPDSAINRTYNSLGQFNDENADNWANFYSRVVDHGGAGINQPGAYLDRLDHDGGRTRYYWDASFGAYVSREGGGAYDKIGYDGSSWWWQDGDSGIKEIYGASYNNRVVSRIDRDGNAISYSYASATGNLTRITTADGNYTDFVWSGNNLIMLTTTYTDTQTGQTKTLTRTRYTYSGNRLASVTTDLSPQDSSVADARVYTTNYTYDGNGRVATIAQTDGTYLSFTYDSQGRVASFTENVDVGVTRTTSFAYGASYTYITDAQGNLTTLYYDSAGQLIRIDEPAAVSGGNTRITEFVYYSNGDLYYTSIYDGISNYSQGIIVERVFYRYDSNGNVFDIYTTLPGQGYNVTRYYYGTKNELLTATSYTGFDPDGHGGVEPTGGMTTRYIYDSETHLRFIASPEGRVTEYRYDAAGNRVAEIAYQLNTVGTAGLPENFSWSEQDFINWLASISDKSATARTDTTYDFRGNVSMVTSYARVDVAGNGILDDGVSRTLYVYDQFGSLLSKRNVVGTAASTYTNLSEFAYYDLSSTPAAPIYGKPANQYTVTTAGGWTAVYNGMAATVENETITSSFTVMGTGTNPSLTLGLYGSSSYWGTNEFSVARIVSGPGQIVQELGGLWNVTGLSNSVPTRIEVTRIFRQAEGFCVYLYVDRPNGQRLGQGVILSDPVVSRATTATETYAYDGMGRMIRHTDAKGVGTWTSYVDALNRTVTTLANGLTTTSVYNRAGELVASTEARGGVGQENVINSDINSWASNATLSAAGSIDGAPATQYTTAPGQTYAYAYSHAWVEAGETMTWTISLRGAGGLTSAALGVWGGTYGWGSVNLSSARIISGPGSLTQSQTQGGYFDVSGLSATEVTRVEVTRLFTQAEYAYPHFYTYGAVGQGVVVAAQNIAKSRYMTAAGGGSAFDTGQFDINNWGYGGGFARSSGHIGRCCSKQVCGSGNRAVVRGLNRLLSRRRRYHHIGHHTKGCQWRSLGVIWHFRQFDRLGL